MVRWEWVGRSHFVLGSVMLIDTDVPGYEIPWSIIATVTGRELRLLPGRHRHGGAGAPAAGGQRRRAADRRNAARSSSTSTDSGGRACTARTGRCAARHTCGAGCACASRASMAWRLIVEPDTPSKRKEIEHARPERNRRPDHHRRRCCSTRSECCGSTSAASIFQLGRFWRVKGPGPGDRDPRHPADGEGGSAHRHHGRAAARTSSRVTTSR